MFHPPSLAQDILERSFRAQNGELGIRFADCAVFLDACEADGVKLYGWDLWLVDHVWDPTTDSLQRVAGKWSGLIPAPGPSVYGGEGDVEQTRAALADLQLDDIDSGCLPHLRVNFTL